MSLLVKCKFLASIKEIFQRICYICLSPTLNQVCLSEIETMQKLIKDRPQDKINELIDESFKDKNESLILNSTTNEANKTSTKIKFDSDEKKIKNARKQTIRDRSPFSVEFLHIQNAAQTQIDQLPQIEEENVLFNPSFVKHLNEKFMPYCFIWASFTCQDLNINSLTNGTIEKYQGTIKGESLTNILPHKYAHDSFLRKKGLQNKMLNYFIIF